MIILCPQCHLPHPEDTECWFAQSEVMAAILKNIGDPGNCRGCNAAIYWVKHKNGKPTPYDASGLNHFISCPKREQFSTKGKTHDRTSYSVQR